MSSGDSSETRQWSPDPSILEQVALMLQALRDPTRSDHQQALHALNNDTSNPTFILHLLEIFTHGDSYEGLSSDLRQLAGLIIKNYVFKQLNSLHDSSDGSGVFQILKHGILQCLKDPLKDIRSTAGILIGRICDGFPFPSWSEFIQPLLELLQSGNDVYVDGSLRAVQRMCEDACEKLTMDTSIRPLEFLIPSLLHLLSSPEPTFRLRALESLNSLIFLVPSTQQAGSNSCALITHMGSFLSGLSHLASDENAPVRRAVCQAITLLASFQLAVLEPLMSDICRFMLQAVLDPEEPVALEACEFWWVLLENHDGCNYLIHQHTNETHDSFVSALIHHLIARLPLTQAQIEYERDEEEAENSGDKEISFNPIHYRRSTTTGRHEEEEEDDGEGNSEEVSSMWTVRKEAARVLDIVSCAIPTEVTLSIALPILQENLGSTNVWSIEAGVLGLGTLSRGCSDEVAPVLPSLLPFLLSCVSGSVSVDCPPELRCVTAWVIGRYSYYWFENSEDKTYEDLQTQKSILFCLLENMPSSPPKLQAGICAALCAIFEAASTIGNPPPLSPEDHCINIIHVSLTEILQHIHSCFQTFGVKNFLLLCDTLATLCDSMEPLSLQQPSSPQATSDGSNPGTLSGIFLPTLISKFYAVLSSDSQPNIAAFANSFSINGFALHQYAFPVLECVTSVARAVGRDIIPFAAGIVSTCLHLIHDVCNVYDQLEAASATAAISGGGVDDLPDPPSKDFIVCALDVLGGVMEGLEHDFVSIAFPNGNENEEQLQIIFVQQLMRCLCDNESGDVRQSAFSLFGDLVSKCRCISLLFAPAISQRLINIPLPSREDTSTNLTSHPSDEIPYSIIFIFQLCLLNMSTELTKVFPLVSSNVIWSLGEMVLTLENSIARIYGPILANHVLLLLKEVSNPSPSFATAVVSWADGSTLVTLKQNLSICLGRIAMMCPQEIADDNQSMLCTKEALEGWFRALKLVQFSSERDQAFYGVVAVLNARPQVLLENNSLIEQFVLSCASWDRPPGLPQVQQELHNILMAIRVSQSVDGQSENPAWGRLLSRMESNTVRRMCDIFQLPRPSAL